MARRTRSCVATWTKALKVVFRCRSSLKAINDSETSFLQLLLPHALNWTAVLNGLLALTVRYSERTPEEYQHYLDALSEVRVEISRLEVEHADTLTTLRVLSSSYLLGIFALAQCDTCWVQHVRGMINIVRVSHQDILRSSMLGWFLVSSCAHQDISAFSVGRKQQSQKAWLAWMMHPLDRRQSAFTPFETTTGYPESLVNVIALVSEAVDDNVLHHMRKFPEAPPISQELEISLLEWSQPPPLASTKPMEKVALQLAWESMQMAALIFLWRGYGFHSDLRQNMCSEKLLKSRTYTRKIVSNIGIVLRSARQSQTSIGSALLWPLTIAGCECSGNVDDTRREVIDLLKIMRNLFSMDHTSRVEDVLETLWQNLDSNIEAAQQFPSSLESVVIEKGLVIPLL